MRTIYLFDDRYRYYASVDIGPRAWRPKQSVLTPPPEIPAGSEAVWRGVGWAIVPSGAVDPPDFVAAEAAIRSEGARRLEALAGSYSPPERETWATQQREARAWLADPQAATPMLSAIAGGREITVEEIVGKVMENVAIFESASGEILGAQQALLVSLWTVAADPESTMKQLAAINW